MKDIRLESADEADLHHDRLHRIGPDTDDMEHEEFSILVGEDGLPRASSIIRRPSLPRRNLPFGLFGKKHFLEVAPRLTKSNASLILMAISAVHGFSQTPYIEVEVRKLAEKVGLSPSQVSKGVKVCGGAEVLLIVGKRGVSPIVLLEPTLLWDGGVARLRDTSYLYEEEKKWAKAALPYVERQKKREELAAHLAAQADKRKAFAEKKSRERLATWLTAQGLIAERVGPRPLSPWEIAETRAIAGHSPYPAEILPHRPAPCPQTAQDWFALSHEDKEIYLDRALEEDDGQILFYLDNIMFPFVERTLSGERLDQAIQIVFPEAQTRTLDIGVLVREWREHHITDLEDLALMIGVSLQLTPEELIDYLAGDLSPLAEFAPLVQRAASQ